MAMAIWGTQGTKHRFFLGLMKIMTRQLAAGGPYAAIAALTNIPATVVAACIYEFILTDSDRGPSH